MTYSHPAAIVAALEAIDEDLAQRQNQLEQAADDRARLIRDWERRLALSTAQARGGDANARKQAALVLAAEQDDLYERLTVAEGRYAGLAAVVRVLDTRSTIGMALLKAQARA